MTRPENCGTTFCSCIECVNPDGPEWYLKQVDETQGHTRELCPTCGEVAAFTGSCGTSYNDAKALCKRTALPHAHSSELKPYQQRTINILEKFYPPALDDRREGLTAHHVYCRVVTEDV